jgi:glutamate N-acetyltransferase/amino-acid N-acetyltransferase
MQRIDCECGNEHRVRMLRHLSPQATIGCVLKRDMLFRTSSALAAACNLIRMLCRGPRSSSALLKQLRHLTSTSTSPPFKFESSQEYYAYLNAHHARLPWGFSVGSAQFNFTPEEAPHLPASMTMTLIKPHKPTSLFGAVFTQNACPGAPIKIGKTRLQEETLGAILINNKISNVCASGGGVADAQEVCNALANHLEFPSGKMILPSSTGVIGWRLPVDAMIEHMPALLATMQDRTILPAASGIMTTDLYPKVRSADVCGGRIVGIAKGAGMVEPNMVLMRLSISIFLDLDLDEDPNEATAEAYLYINV